MAQTTWCFQRHFLLDAQSVSMDDFGFGHQWHRRLRRCNLSKPVISDLHQPISVLGIDYNGVSFSVENQWKYMEGKSLVSCNNIDVCHIRSPQRCHTVIHLHPLCTDSIIKTFFITSGTFAVTSAYGYFTKKDLSKWGSFLFMALDGLIIALVANIFLKSSMLDFIISIAGVLLFVGLTIWDSQNIKRQLAIAPDMSETSQKIALCGALDLYLDFINLFIYLLRLFGRDN